MTAPRVVIVDSGICNLFNVKRAFESLSASVTVTRSRRDILTAERIVMPGVGAFGAGMDSLRKHDLIEPIQMFARSGKPILGVCLGMQMLLSVSEEQGLWTGLDLIEGRVRALKQPDPAGAKYKIPQIGWNFIERNPRFERSNDSWKGTILESLGTRPCMYFVHSYIAEPKHDEWCLAYTNYGFDRFCSVLRKDNICGCQFHPERSGEAGRMILQNFLRMT